MAKTTANYELLYILDPDKSEEELAAMVEKFTALIKEHGEFKETDLWGKRRMAYPINDKPDGYYILTHFASAPDFPAELDRVLGITDGVMRSLITTVEE
ncbi:MAG: 30S ribosomal protein S6 [Oscillospiraceae bacterium]|jgi:small subunit ribosomal protein S6|nr:30S ribosomal protein S6 [Oscillospiraceae bacterium]